MATLVLIRHGQARDGLSPTGELQALRLRDYWARRGVTFDDAFSGSLTRQRQTAELALGGATQVRPAFNEYDAEGILTHLAPTLAAGDPGFARLWADRQGGNRGFQKMFEVLVPKWMDGSLAAPGVETWAAFHTRVAEAIHQVQRDSPSGRRVAVFTSGGVIGVAVALALRTPDHSALEANWRVKNGSLTEFTFTRDRLSLDSFNAIPHLDDPALVTFR
ncbi:MAG: histidine phosphatase family protein [Candidatus Solibacter usitatus]|nr:histidine phosphatase family protein [Candidatus Solibacter usitatus]